LGWRTRRPAAELVCSLSRCMTEVDGARCRPDAIGCWQRRSNASPIADVLLSRRACRGTGVRNVLSMTQTYAYRYFHPLILDSLEKLLVEVMRIGQTNCVLSTKPTSVSVPPNPCACLVSSGTLAGRLRVDLVSGVWNFLAFQLSARHFFRPSCSGRRSRKVWRLEQRNAAAARYFGHAASDVVPCLR